MNIIDHGEWEAYTPTEFPQNVPKWALCARRKTDLVDWYVYIYPNVDPPPPLMMDADLKSIKHTFTHRDAPVVTPLSFGAGNIKCAAHWQDTFDAYIVGPVTKNVTKIFPSGSIVFEITDYPGTEDEAFAEFNGKAYDPTTHTFSEPAEVNPPVTALSLLQAKVIELEKEIKRMAQERG
jgi:hypothetical protein